MNRRKVVLAYSGGLDTSFCIKYLSQIKKLDVYSVFVNCGGFEYKEIQQLQKRAISLGAIKHISIEADNEYYEKCIKYLIYGNILKNHVYPLSVAAERVVQALTIARYAKKIKANYLAHGSTGAGNDQVRFDVIFNILAPNIEILTPVRDQQLSREQEIAFLETRGITMDWRQKKYSINQGLWGTTIGGRETLTSDISLPDEAYPGEITMEKSKTITLHFKKGQYCGFNNHFFTTPVEAIKSLNRSAAVYGIGRDMHTGDTVLGIKGRIGFEAPAAMIIIKAHEALEKHILTRWQLYWKAQLANWYGTLLHDGMYLEPVMRNIEIFLEDTQYMVNGEVNVKLHRCRFEIIGIKSPHDLMQTHFGTYGEKPKTWNGDDVRGFAKIMANQSRIYYSVNGKNEHD